MTLQNACKQFLDHCHSVMSLSDHTLRAYDCDLRDFQTFAGGAAQLDKLCKDTLRAYIGNLRHVRHLKESTIKRRVASLKLLFKWLLLEAMIQNDPFTHLNERIRLPKRLPRSIDSWEAARLKSALTARPSKDDYDTLREKLSVALLLETGIRVGELTRIQLGDVSHADKRIKIHGKGNRQRFTYLISQEINRMLGTYLAFRARVPSRSDALLVTAAGKPLLPPQIRRSLQRLKKNAGIDRHITPHMLRHTCATQWLEDGLDIRHVQKLLGHHSISTTEIYTHVSDQSLVAAL